MQAPQASTRSKRGLLRITIEYDTVPRQSFITEVREMVRREQGESRVQLMWKKINEESEDSDMEERAATNYCTRNEIRGYEGENPPILRGLNYCGSCYCSPCVIQSPPSFLRGSCDPHPANDQKRYQLYKKFWSLLNKLGVWRDEGYLQLKEARTARDDRRDIMPKCVIDEIRRRYPSHDSQYRDYMSTFDAGGYDESPNDMETI